MRLHRHVWATVFFRHIPYGTVYINECRRCGKRAPVFIPRQGLLP